jgi:hypothetical protein
MLLFACCCYKKNHRNISVDLNLVIFLGWIRIFILCNNVQVNYLLIFLSGALVIFKRQLFLRADSIFVFLDASFESQFDSLLVF